LRLLQILHKPGVNGKSMIYEKTAPKDRRGRVSSRLIGRWLSHTFTG
jgi:hypothetical protein